MTQPYIKLNIFNAFSTVILNIFFYKLVLTVIKSGNSNHRYYFQPKNLNAYL